MRDTELIFERLTDDAFLLHNVLSQQECDHHIAYAEQAGFERATVSLAEGPKLITGIRNNQRLTQENADLARSLWERIKTYMPKIDAMSATSLNPILRYYKYSVGERFNKHRDGRVKGVNAESRLSFIIYLNSDFTGGVTEFETFEVRPQKGTALCFVHELKHKGCIVERGNKYVLRSDIMFSQ